MSTATTLRTRVDVRARHLRLLTETIAAVNDFMREALAFYPRLRQSDLRLLLVHAGPHLLPELGEDLGVYAARKLIDRGIEIKTSTRVAAVDSERVTFSDGTSVASRLLVWTAGTSPHPLLQALPCRLDRGRVVVDETLAVPGWPGLPTRIRCTVSRVVSFVVPAPQPIVGLSKRLPFHQSG